MKFDAKVWFQKDFDVLRELAGARVFHAVVWRHGFRHIHDILDFMSEHSGFTGLKIIRARYGGHEAMVSDIYRADSVPLRHLSSKTRYLREFPPEVFHLVFSVHSRDVTFWGHSNFRSLETSQLRQMKEGVRARWNPRDSEGGQSHDHVIHIADTSFQSLQYLTSGRIQRQFPRSHFQPKVRKFGYEVQRHAVQGRSVARLQWVPIDLLLVNLLQEGRRRAPVPVGKTPHFESLRTDDRRHYLNYLQKHLGMSMTDWYTWSGLRGIYSKFSEGAQIDPIIAEEFEDRFFVLDGAHRSASALLAGHNSIPALVVSR